MDVEKAKRVESPPLIKLKCMARTAIVPVNDFIRRYEEREWGAVRKAYPDVFDTRALDVDIRACKWRVISSLPAFFGATVALPLIINVGILVLRVPDVPVGVQHTIAFLETGSLVTLFGTWMYTFKLMTKYDRLRHAKALIVGYYRPMWLDWYARFMPSAPQQSTS